MSMTISDLARFLAENNLVLHVERRKPSRSFIATLESADAFLGHHVNAWSGTNLSPGKAISIAMAKFETWLQGKPRTSTAST